MLVDRAIAVCQERSWPVLGLSVGIEGQRLDQMRELFAKRQVTLLETPSPKSAPELYYETDGHWNARGHAHIADLLIEAMPHRGQGRGGWQ